MQRLIDLQAVKDGLKTKGYETTGKLAEALSVLSPAAARAIVEALPRLPTAEPDGPVPGLTDGERRTAALCGVSERAFLAEKTAQAKR